MLSSYCRINLSFLYLRAHKHKLPCIPHNHYLWSMSYDTISHSYQSSLILIYKPRSHLHRPSRNASHPCKVSCGQHIRYSSLLCDFYIWPVRLWWFVDAYIEASMRFSFVLFTNNDLILGACYIFVTWWSSLTIIIMLGTCSLWIW